jgi:hypothetical protein
MASSERARWSRSDIKAAFSPSINDALQDVTIFLSYEFASKSPQTNPIAHLEVSAEGITLFPNEGRCPTKYPTDWSKAVDELGTPIAVLLAYRVSRKEHRKRWRPVSKRLVQRSLPPPEPRILGPNEEIDVTAERPLSLMDAGRVEGLPQSFAGRLPPIGQVIDRDVGGAQGICHIKILHLRTDAVGDLRFVGFTIRDWHNRDKRFDYDPLNANWNESPKGCEFPDDDLSVW